MKWKLFSILILNVNLIFSAICTIKNDRITRLLVSDPNSGYSIIIEPNETRTIDSTLKGLKRLFVNETLNFSEEEKQNSKSYRLSYQLRDNDHSRKVMELSYSQIEQNANQTNHNLVITAFK